MALRGTPLAIDGGMVDSAMLRLGTFNATSGSEGVVHKNDMKVKALAVPGNGVAINGGSALVLNRYQTNPSETYSVTDLGGTDLDAGDMPPADAAARSHLVCVTVGDPEFSQSGHPWMLSTEPAAGLEEEFQYVRYHVIQNVPSTTERFADLLLHYPAYALARIDVPANTTTITDDMIVDLRTLANPRSVEYIEHKAAGADNLLNGGLVGGVRTPGEYENWPGTAWIDVFIPDWAVKAKCSGFIEGAKLIKEGRGTLRIGLEGGGSTTVTNVNEGTPQVGVERRSYNLGGEISIAAEFRGSTQRMRVEGTPRDEASKGFLSTGDACSAQLRIVFVEVAE